MNQIVLIAKKSIAQIKILLDEIVIDSPIEQSASQKSSDLEKITTSPVNAKCG
jgi:hypothetical protein